MKQILLFLLFGTRGGDMRSIILKQLQKKPQNMHQLSKACSVDYKTIQHHILVLEKNNVIMKIGEKYGAIYVISDLFKVELEEIWKQFGNK